jgi:hypothetical protein
MGKTKGEETTATPAPRFAVRWVYQSVQARGVSMEAGQKPSLCYRGTKHTLCVAAGHPVRVLTRVFLPLAAPAILVAAAVTFIVSWSQYLLTLLPGAGEVITPPILVLAASSGGNPAATAAIALVTAIPPALAVLLVVRMMDTPPRWAGAPA